MRSNSEAGFTLLEVLVATAIMALAFGALFPIFSASHARVVSIEARQAAVEVANNVLNVALLESNWQSLPKEGKEGDWDWAITKSTPTQEQLDAPEGYELVIEVQVIHRTRAAFPEVFLTKVAWVQP